MVSAFFAADAADAADAAATAATRPKAASRGSHRGDSRRAKLPRVCQVRKISHPRSPAHIASDRRAKNNKSVQEYRLRKKTQVANLQASYEDVTHKVEELRVKVAMLHAENETLRQRLQAHYGAYMPGAWGDVCRPA